MGLSQSTEAAPKDADAFDLVLDIAVDEHAIAPEYPSSGSAAFSIFAPQDLTVSTDSWTFVRTGLTFRLPFMLVVSISSCKPCLTAQPTLVDCDDDDKEVVLPLLYKASGQRGDGPQQITVRRGEPIAWGLVLPIARPGFRLYTPKAERV